MQSTKQHGCTGRINGHIDWDLCRTALHLCVDWKREMIYLIAERYETTAFELNAAIQPRSGSQVNSKGFLFSWCWLWEVQNYRVQTSLWSSYLLISYANTELVGSDLMNNQMCLYYPLLALGSWARVSFCSHCEASVCPSLQPRGRYLDWSRSWRLTRKHLFKLKHIFQVKFNFSKTTVGSRHKFIYLLPKLHHHRILRPERYRIWVYESVSKSPRKMLIHVSRL